MSMVVDPDASEARSFACGGWRLVACVLPTLLLLGCWVNYDRLMVTNDATQSISVARHLFRGEGIRTGIIYYEEQYATGQVPAPQTVFPPGYPALIALVSLIGLSVPCAASVVVSVSFAAVTVLMLLTARWLRLSLPFAIVLTLAWCGCVQCWNVTRACMSEMPFIALTLLSLYLLPKRATLNGSMPHGGEGADHGGGRVLLLVWLSGCAAAAAFTMRYAGVFWFITVAGFYAVSLRERFWWNLRSALTWGSVPIVTVTVLFWRNHQLSGEWTGGNKIGSQRSLMFTLGELYNSLSHLFGWSQQKLAEGAPAELLLTASLGVFVAWLILCRRSLRVDRQQMTDIRRDVRLLLSFGYVVTTICLLIILDSRTPIGIGPRKLLPLVPFALLGLGSVLSGLSIESRQSRRVLQLASGLLLIAVILGQIHAWRVGGGGNRRWRWSPPRSRGRSAIRRCWSRCSRKSRRKLRCSRTNRNGRAISLIGLCWGFPRRSTPIASGQRRPSKNLSRSTECGV